MMCNLFDKMRVISKIHGQPSYLEICQMSSESTFTLSSDTFD